MSAVQTDNAVIEALRARQSMGRVRPERPPRELVERVIEAAGWAPNHYRTEPWRFFVVAGRAREDLGEAMASALAAKLADAPADEARDLIERERRKPLRAPVIIVVAVIPSETAKVVEVEEIAGTSAAVQNMLLAAEALGLGAMWRTGASAYDPAIKRFLHVPERGHILA